MRPKPRVFTVPCRGFEELRHAAPQTGERSLWQCQCKVATAVVSVYFSISTSLFLISPFYLDFILHLILVFTYYFPFSSLSHTLTHLWSLTASTGLPHLPQSPCPFSINSMFHKVSGFNKLTRNSVFMAHMRITWIETNLLPNDIWTGEFATVSASCKITHNISLCVSLQQTLCLKLGRDVGL